MADEVAELLISVKMADGSERTFSEVRKGFEETAEGAEDASDSVDDSAESLRKLVRLQAAEHLARVALAMKQVAGAGKELFDALDKTASETAEASRQADRWARSLNLTANEVEALSRIMAQAGAGDDLADVGDIIKEIGVKAQDAARGNEDLQKVFDRLGVSVPGAMRNATQATFEVIDALSRAEGNTQALIDADELLSDMGVRLVGNLRGQGTTLTELQRTTLESIKVTDEHRAQFDRLSEANRNLDVAEKELARTVATSVSPAIADIKTKLADLYTQIVTTNPEFATFIGLAKEGAKPASDVATGIFQIAVSAKLMGVNLSKAVPWLGKAGLYGALVALVGIFPSVVQWMERTADAAEQSASRFAGAWRWAANGLLGYVDMIDNALGRLVGLENGLWNRDDSANQFGGGQSSGHGAGRSWGPDSKQPPWKTPDLPPISAPDGGVGGTPPMAVYNGESEAEKRIRSMQATRASIQSQIRRAEADKARAEILADTALAEEAAARLKAAEAKLAEVEDQLIAAGDAQIKTDLLTEQAERRLRQAEEAKRIADTGKADRSMGIGETIAKQEAEALTKARQATMDAVREGADLARTSMQIAELTGSLDQQEQAATAYARALDNLATAAAEAGDQLGALQAMEEKARLQKANADKLTIGQEILAAGGVGSVEEVLRRTGRGTINDMSGILTPPAVSVPGLSPQQLGKQVGEAAAPEFQQAVTSALSAVANAIRGGIL